MDSETKFLIFVSQNIDAELTRTSAAIKKIDKQCCFSKLHPTGFSQCVFRTTDSTAIAATKLKGLNECYTKLGVFNFLP